MLTWSETSKPVPIPDMGGMWSAVERIVDMSMGTTRSCNWMNVTSYIVHIMRLLLNPIIANMWYQNQFSGKKVSR